jgi:hypothetical protein
MKMATIINIKTKTNCTTGSSPDNGLNDTIVLA